MYNRIEVKAIFDEMYQMYQKQRTTNTSTITYDKEKQTNNIYVFKWFLEV